VIAHWDEVAADQDLGQAAGAIDVSVRRLQLAAGEEAAPHIRDTEEVLYVVSGGGWSGDQAIRTEDCVVRRVPHDAEPLRAGDEGPTVVLFATPAHILEGGGTLELWPSPALAEESPWEEHQIRAGHVISRPPSTAISHFFRAGQAGMTFLVYGTRRPNDVCYYPRSNKIFWRGLGLIARLEPLAYDDGEPED